LSLPSISVRSGLGIAPTLLLVPFFTLLLDGCTPQPQVDQDALVELGTYLFFDNRLSGDASISCATCHDPDHAWADGTALSQTYPAADGFRNSKSLLNVSQRSNYYWDGGPAGASVANVTAEMIGGKLFLNLNDRLLTERLKQIPAYVDLFEQSLAEIPSYEGAIRALEAFQNTLTTQGSTPMGETAQRGSAVFESNCASCHSGEGYTDGLPHAMRVPENPDITADPLRHTAFRLYLKDHNVPDHMSLREDPGHLAQTGDERHRAAFITPDLRQVADTAPYMHNGIFDTLDDVVAFYSDGGMDLSLEESSDLIAFLESLSGTIPHIEEPEMPPYEVSQNWAEVSN